MPSTLVVGATRGLGAALVSLYASKRTWTVYATTRSSSAPSSPSSSHNNIHWLTSIDLTRPSCGSDLVSQLPPSITIDTTYITAGYFATEDFSTAAGSKDGPNWEKELTMYTTSSIAPVFLVHSLAHSSRFTSPAKVVLVSSESGSITLRHAQEGGGNFGHHGSKAATNMVGKQLSFDLKDAKVAVGIVHPSFMRTEMTAGVGFDKFWDAGGALEPAEAAERMERWVEGSLTMERSGEYWAPRGTRDVGNWKVVMGEGKGEEEGPTQLPW